MPTLHSAEKWLAERSARGLVRSTTRRELDDPLGFEVVDAAVDLYRAARRAGLTVRSSVDCLIAATALRHDAGVLHHDRGVSALAKIAPLRQRAVR